MTAQTLRDLDFAIFHYLGHQFPKGYAAEFLFESEIRFKVNCTLPDLEARLVFFEGLGLVKQIAQDQYIPDLPPHWALTSQGVIEARKRGCNTK